MGGRGDRGELEWYENPGTAEGDWPAHPIVTLDGVDWLDRVRLSDLSCDGRLDLIVSEENGSSRGAETYWVEQPEDLSRDPWRPHLLTSQGSTNSLDVVDIDRDGDADIVTGEHKGKLRVIVWENVRCGVFQPRPIDHGKESHLGTKANDLDRDGDLDLFSVAWDEPASIYLWRNDSVARRPPR